MVTFNDFLPINPHNDRVVQRALGDIDTDVLSMALLSLPGDVQAIFYRNMSKRAYALLLDDMSTRHGVHLSKIKAAQDLLTQLLQKHAKDAESEEPAGDTGAIPDVSTDTPESIVASFCSLAAYVRRHGILPLEKLETSITHPLLRKGVEFLVDGSDPLMVRSILEKYRDTWLQQAKATMNMIVDGIDSLAAREHPYLVEQKLRAYVAQDALKG